VEFVAAAHFVSASAIDSALIDDPKRAVPNAESTDCCAIQLVSAADCKSRSYGRLRWPRIEDRRQTRVASALYGRREELVDDRTGEDRAVIALSHKLAVLYWTCELSCTGAELRAAVRAVGPIVANVRAYVSRARSGK
jgi:Protein of unknown function (DUF3606)